MTRPLDQSLLETVTALIDGLEHAKVRYCLIGALVPELLLKTPPPRRTNDADAVVQIETLEDFERVKNALTTHRVANESKVEGPRGSAGSCIALCLPFTDTQTRIRAANRGITPFVDRTRAYRIEYTFRRLRARRRNRRQTGRFPFVNRRLLVRVQPGEPLSKVIDSSRLPRGHFALSNFHRVTI